MTESAVGRLLAGVEVIGFLYRPPPEISSSFVVSFRFEPTEAFEKYRALFEEQNESGWPTGQKPNGLARAIDALDLRLEFQSSERSWKLSTVVISGHKLSWRPAFCRPEDVA